jgi:hypothetical protein
VLLIFVQRLPLLFSTLSFVLPTKIIILELQRERGNGGGIPRVGRLLVARDFVLGRPSSFVGHDYYLLSGRFYIVLSSHLMRFLIPQPALSIL